MHIQPILIGSGYPVAMAEHAETNLKARPAWDLWAGSRANYRKLPEGHWESEGTGLWTDPSIHILFLVFLGHKHIPIISNPSIFHCALVCPPACCPLEKNGPAFAPHGLNRNHARTQVPCQMISGVLLQYESGAEYFRAY